MILLRCCGVAGVRSLSTNTGFCAGTYEMEGEEVYNAVRWALEVRCNTLFDDRLRAERGRRRR